MLFIISIITTTTIIMSLSPSSTKVARDKQRARIARRTRQLEKLFSTLPARRAKKIPADWLPTEHINLTIYTRKTLAALFDRARSAGLVNETNCYGLNQRTGCDPVCCDQNCAPVSVTVAVKSVFFFVGVGKLSEQRRIFQDGGHKCWAYKSSVVSKRDTDDPDYSYKRYLGVGPCAGLRRAVVQFRDREDSGDLIWVLIYLAKDVVLPGRRIYRNVSSAVWNAKPADFGLTRVARRRYTHGQFDKDKLVPGSVYLLPTDFSFDEDAENYMRIREDGRDVTFVKKPTSPEAPYSLVVQQEKAGNRLMVRIGCICNVCGGDDVAMTSDEYQNHLVSGDCK